MQQVFGTDNHYIQDDGRGHGIIFLPFGLVRTLETRCSKANQFQFDKDVFSNSVYLRLTVIGKGLIDCD